MPSHILQGLPPGFDAWFARALDRDPSRRFASATEMADALASVAGISVRRGPSSSPRATAPSYRSPSQAPQGVVTPGYGSSPHHSPSAGVTPYAPTTPAVPYGKTESLPNVTATGLSASQAHLSRSTRPTGLYVGIALGALGALAAGIIAVVAFVSSQRGDAPKGAATQVSIPKDPEPSSGAGTATLPIVPTLASAEAATVDAGGAAAADDDDGEPSALAGSNPSKSKVNGGGKSTKHVSATNATAPPTSAGPAAGATTPPPANKPGKPLLPPDF